MVRGTVYAKGAGPLLSYAAAPSAVIGTATVVTPAVGERLRIYYVSYNPPATMVCSFTLSGQTFLKNAVPADSIIAKDFGDLRWIEGAINASLTFTQTVNGSVNVNVLYQSVP